MLSVTALAHFRDRRDFRCARWLIEMMKRQCGLLLALEVGKTSAISLLVCCKMAYGGLIWCYVTHCVYPCPMSSVCKFRLFFALLVSSQDLRDHHLSLTFPDPLIEYAGGASGLSAVSGYFFSLRMVYRVIVVVFGSQPSIARFVNQAKV